MDDPFKSVQFEERTYITPVGELRWRPNWEAIREHLFPQLVEAARAADAEDPDNEAVDMVRHYLQLFFTMNIQDAARLAVEELTALAKASATRDRHERGEIAKQAAEKARGCSLERLRASRYFTRLPKRGHKKRTPRDQWIDSFIDDRALFKARLDQAITSLLKKGMKVTLEDIAASMNMGSRGTGGRMLGRELKEWANSKEEPRKILNDIVAQLKTELLPPD
jgi:hypothetical protein